MTTLTALCGTLVPPLLAAERADAAGRGRGEEAAEVFLRTLATDAPVPGEVAQFMARACLPEAWALALPACGAGTGADRKSVV